jgi:hypothetical protein
VRMGRSAERRRRNDEGETAWLDGDAASGVRNDRYGGDESRGLGLLPALQVTHGEAGARSASAFRRKMPAVPSKRVSPL